MSELAHTALFYLLAAITLVAALGVALGRNLVHSALSLTVSFLGVAGLYLLLYADFLAAVQILVYAGTVAVLIALGIMLTRRASMDDSNPDRSGRSRFLAALLALGFAGLVGCAAASAVWPQTAAPAWDTVSGLAELMLGKYALAFETVAVLLLVAMLGAIVLAKGADEV